MLLETVISEAVQNWLVSTSSQAYKDMALQLNKMNTRRKIGNAMHGSALMLWSARADISVEAVLVELAIQGLTNDIHRALNEMAGSGPSA